MNIVVEIAQEEEKWDAHHELNVDCATEIVKKILQKYPNFSKANEIELSLLFTNDTKIKSLNNEFRNKNKATNVLSFPDIEINWRSILEFEVNNEYMYLGDVAFSYETIKQEALLKSISFEDHFKHLLIHAILHLIGYDHMNDEEAEVMETIETEILNSFGIKSPY